jgi:hypothetical protein
MRTKTSALVGAIVVVAMAGTGVGAQDADCDAARIAAPIETVPIPDGWRLAQLGVSANLSYVSIIDVDIETGGQVSFSISCSPLGAEAAARDHELKTTLLGAEPVDIGELGDFAYATKRDPSGATYIDGFGEQDAFLWIEATWGRDGMVVTASSQAQDLEVLTAVLQGLDDLLPS